MPVFRYKCSDCGEITEIMKGVTGEDDKLICGKCSSVKLEKLVPKPNVAGRGRTPHRHQGSCCGNAGGCDTPGGCCSE